MGRSLFDPGRAVGAEPIEPVRPGTPAPSAEAGRAQAESAPLTVGQASELINRALEGGLPATIRVVGQVSNLKANNHWYFSLKDEQAVLLCVVWATSVRRIRFKPKDGDEVVVTGHVSHYAQQGRTQMYVEAMQPVGAGALDLKFRALCDELRELGFFADERKKSLPMFPRKVAVITSATGAALADVVKTSAQRCKAVGLVVVDVRVQGDGAAEEIARAIRWVDRKREKLGVDVILVTRGGGAIEDLWAFNERVVADAVFACRLPVVAAIGHESDTTVIELVADVRASTPTQAAMRVVPSAQELCKQIEYLVRRMGVRVEGLLGRKRETVRNVRAELGHRV
ncbi:MAG: exodeoxyribonuclease VII large subunit, partial [Phycisphaerales bacterium]|nr:exodeoxyribonuclease VII large subunit [Phycisphaerales bacterium]